MHLNKSSGKWRQFCLGPNVLMQFFAVILFHCMNKVVPMSVIDALTHGRPSQWRHNGRDGVSNHQPRHCLINRLFRRRSKKTSKLRVTGLCSGNSPVTGEFPTQMVSNAGNVSIWWRHHGKMVFRGHAITLFEISCGKIACGLAYDVMRNFIRNITEPSSLMMIRMKIHMGWLWEILDAVCIIFGVCCVSMTYTVYGQGLVMTIPA